MAPAQDQDRNFMDPRSDRQRVIGGEGVRTRCCGIGHSWIGHRCRELLESGMGAAALHPVLRTVGVELGASLPHVRAFYSPNASKNNILRYS